ncbi:hypothetical protein EJ04DRAFT_513788 [Polyplosphaeria fusca]|uniref:Uncharacterized protein n=1 Tax=Polyplosphaeria fusca TaxID=682080 RepID=A0A9P4QTZ0_9PLEO|nr:hypothetical protein EJ04DRAFT_513788 [Polyplosphaeria fusca]
MDFESMLRASRQQDVPEPVTDTVQGGAPGIWHVSRLFLAAEVGNLASCQTALGISLVLLQGLAQYV